MTAEAKSSTVCPRCQTRYLLPAHLVGRRTVCRVCGLNFHLLPPPQAASTRPATWPFSNSGPPKEGPPAQAPDFFSRLDLRPGQLILDTYEVLSFLGQGGMSQVFRVRHRDWGIDLALKVPRLEFIKKGLSQDFIQEAALWASLGLHPNIATCYYVRSIFGVPAIFAQYAEGGSLNHWIRNAEGQWGRLYHGTIEEVTARILDIAIQAAWGLAYAHAEKLLHLDVKPHNFLLDEKGRLMVTDFGVSRALNQSSAKADNTLAPPRKMEAGSATATARTAFKLPVSSGTPEYYSPERAAQNEPSVGDDLWAWALSLLEMFWGGRYWEVGSVAGETLKEQRRGGETALKAPLPLPGLAADFLEKCFAPEPGRRPASLAEAAQGLIDVYERLLKRRFPQTRPSGGKNTSASLNNRAVSFLDLGLNQEAEELFGQALAGEPCHLEATFNRGLFQWRQGLISDDTLLGHLAGLSGRLENEAELGLLTAQVHLERGDPAAAEEALSGQAAGELARETVNLKNLISQLRFSGRRSLKAQGPFSSPMVGLAASPDGRRLLTALADRTIRIYQSGKLEVIGEFSSGLEFAGAALLKKGPAIVAGYLESEPELIALRFFHLETGERRLERITDFKSLTGLAVLPEAGFKGYLALTGPGGANPVELLDLASGQAASALLGPEEPLKGLAASSSGRFLGAYSQNNIYIWELKTGELKEILGDSDSGWSGLALNDQGQALASRGDEVLFYKALADKPVKLAGHRGPVSFLNFLDGQKMALTACHDGRLRLWDLQKSRCLFTFTGHQAPVTMTRIINNGGAAVSYGQDGYLRHWNLAGPVRRPQASYRLAKAALAAPPPEPRPEAGRSGPPPDNPALAELAKIAAAPGPVDFKTAWDLVSQEPELLAWPLAADLLALKKHLYSRYPHEDLIGYKALDPLKHGFGQPRAGILNGKWSARGSGQDLSLQVLEPGRAAETAGEDLVFELSEEITSLAFSPGGRVLAVSGHEGGMWLFQPSRPEPRYGQTRWERPVLKSAFLNLSGSEVGHLLTLDQQGLLASWKLSEESGPPEAPEASLQLAKGFTGHLAAAGAPALVLTAGLGGSENPEAALINWPLNPKKVRKWALPAPPAALELSPWGELAALGLSDGLIIISRLENPAKAILKLERDGKQPVTALAFSPDSRFLAAAYEDGRLHIWNLRDGQARLTDNHDPDLTLISLSFSPEAAFLNGLARKGFLKSWALTWRLGENPPQAVWDQRAEKALASWRIDFGRDSLNSEPGWEAASQYLSRGGLGLFDEETLTAKLAELAQRPPRKPAVSFSAKIGFWVRWSRLFSKLAFWRSPKNPC